MFSLAYSLFLNLFQYLIESSIVSLIFAIVLTHSIGYIPVADSPESIIEVLISYIALATSLTSALVGLGFNIIDSNICVAVITGFPALAHLDINSFCLTGTSSIGISTPKSPLATIIPSDTSKILSKLFIPSLFSIL